MKNLKVGDTVETKDGRRGKLTAIHATRFGWLGSLDHDNKVAWALESLKKIDIATVTVWIIDPEQGIRDIFAAELTLVAYKRNDQGNDDEVTFRGELAKVMAMLDRWGWGRDMHDWKLNEDGVLVAAELTEQSE